MRLVCVSISEGVRGFWRMWDRYARISGDMYTVLIGDKSNYTTFHKITLELFGLVSNL